MKGKIKWIIIGIVAVIIIAIATIFIINELQFSYEIEEITEINYTTLVHEGKYGVIDKTGTIIVEPIYNAIWNKSI